MRLGSKVLLWTKRWKRRRVFTTLVELERERRRLLNHLVRLERELSEDEREGS